MAKVLNEMRRGRSRANLVKDLDVFINCPFDTNYKPFFNAIVWTVIRSGYRARCAMEADDAAQNRLGKIMDIISECRLSVHDISRTETDGEPPLPRFNMPLELGLWFGAGRFGGSAQKSKRCIVFDREQFRYQKFISDISGQDLHSHDGDVTTLISEVAAWLRHQPGGERPGGGRFMIAEYGAFEAILPTICSAQKLTVEELTFGDFALIASASIARLRDDSV